MIYSTNITSCDEFYVIEKTILVIVKIAGEPATIRIEALQSLPQGKYSTRAYIEENVTVQPTYPQTGNKFDKKPENVRVWIDYSLPWTHRESADEALNQALGFLHDSLHSSKSSD